MLKLMKYEFRKTMFSKMILLVVTAIAELAYLIGVFAKNNEVLGYGSVGLLFCGIFGIIYIGIESLISFHRDLNTKQSYMLFLTPNSSYKILGAKVIENGLSILIVGACFAGLAALDMTIGMLYIGGVKQFLEVLESFAHIKITWNGEIIRNFLIIFMSMLSSWILAVTSGYLAILLAATVLAGKRLSGFASFLVYLVITWGLGTVSDRLLGFLPADSSSNVMFLTAIVLMLLFSAIMYMVTGWIMERKLSV
ncbi:MAG: hypothetical protein ACOX8M_01975 [Marvinbryantia sp.]|jgi:ABC-2 type transport system permease protein